MMDDHFSKMLAPAATATATARSPFVPAVSYQGSRPGYIFQMNTQGLGYYLDPLQNAETEIEAAKVRTLVNPCWPIFLCICIARVHICCASHC